LRAQRRLAGVAMDTRSSPSVLRDVQTGPPSKPSRARMAVAAHVLMQDAGVQTVFDLAEVRHRFRFARLGQDLVVLGRELLFGRAHLSTHLSNSKFDMAMALNFMPEKPPPL
jgi:hypothetical protein